MQLAEEDQLCDKVGDNFALSVKLFGSMASHGLKDWGCNRNFHQAETFHSSGLQAIDFVGWRL